MVHSVFADVVNLQFGDELFSMQNQALPLSSMGATVDSGGKIFTAMNLIPNVEVIQENGCISIGDFYFHSGNVQIWNDSLPPSRSDPACLAQCIREAILSAPPRMGVGHLAVTGAYGKTGLMEHAFMGVLSETRQALARHQEEQAASVLARLCGVGIGLTPAGDDFLCGVLHAMTVYRPRATLRRRLAAAVCAEADGTTAVSRALLKKACQGNAGALLQDLFTAAQPREVLCTARRILQIGHSSGQDLLNGIYFGLTC